jgi:HK97 gp10 family phage protein
MAGSFVRLEGVDELKAALKDLGPRIRTKAVRAALRKGGLVIRAEARRLAPTLQTPDSRRRAGTVRRAISVRPSKFARQGGDEGVFIGVRPLTRAQIGKFKRAQAKRGGRVSGANNPNDPFYWRFVHFDRKYVARTGPTGSGFTVFTQRLRNGEVRQRVRKYSAASLTGRRRSASRVISGDPFLTNAAKNKGAEAIRVFMREALPLIQKLNAKGGR